MSRPPTSATRFQAGTLVVFERGDHCKAIKATIPLRRNSRTEMNGCHYGWFSSLVPFLLEREPLGLGSHTE